MHRKLKKTPQWLRIALVFTLAAVLLAVLFPIKAPIQERSQTLTQGAAPEMLDESKADSEQQTEGKQLQPPKDMPAVSHYRAPESGIALVMDDVGYDLKALKRVLALPFPVAVAVLPDAPNAARAATMAHDAGSVVMLHLPMEPVTPKYRARMSEDFLRVDMGESQVRERFESALEKVPHVTGVNNHMGSLLTTLEPQMRWVMEICRERALFFVDSKTSNSSVAADIASQYGLPWGSRRIFLDHTVEAEDLRMAWAAAVRCAEQQGSCIVIAHPYPETLNFLEQQVTEKDHHFFRPITSMLHREVLINP